VTIESSDTQSDIQHHRAAQLTTRYDHFAVRLFDRIAIVSINRPDKLNSLTIEFWGQLRDLFAELESDPDVRVVIITGAGEKAFSTGGDIVGFAGLADMFSRREFMKATMEGFAAIENSPLPVIAAVNGWALGGGCELTFACDIVIAGDTAQFGMPEAGVGLVPGFGVLRAPSVIGSQWTKFMVFGGERISADEALRLGMVQRVVPADQLLSTAIELAHRIAAQAPVAISMGKQLIGRGVDRNESIYAVDALAILFSTQDAAEGFAAFIDRRPPVFEGR